MILSAMPGQSRRAVTRTVTETGRAVMHRLNSALSTTISEEVDGPLKQGNPSWGCVRVCACASMCVYAACVFVRVDVCGPVASTKVCT